MTLMQFGTDPDASVRAGFVTASVIGIGVIVSALLTAGLSYRSALVMQELALTRAELLRISRTDQLTGLLNRRGFDEAAIAALAKAQEENLPVVALMCDIDRFNRADNQQRRYLTSNIGHATATDAGIRKLPISLCSPAARPRAHAAPASP